MNDEMREKIVTKETTAPELTLSLDGERVSFTMGETIYDVAVRHGKTIPSLCYDSRLEAFGACRLCVVAVKGVRNPVAACTTQAQLDAEVTTNSERLQRHRRTLLEMVRLGKRRCRRG